MVKKWYLVGVRGRIICSQEYKRIISGTVDGWRLRRYDTIDIRRLRSLVSGRRSKGRVMQDAPKIP